MELFLKITETETLSADELNAFRDKALAQGKTAEALLASMIRNEVKPSKKKGGKSK